MSEVVLTVGASHSTLMNTNWHEVEGLDRAEAFRDGLAEAARLILDAQPDAVVLVGSNHFRGFWLDLMPQFTIGVGECSMSGESGTPSGPLHVDTDLARHLCAALVAREFDVAFSNRMQVDHGIAHAVQYLLDGRPSRPPVVPVVVNVFAPPLATLSRCHALGAALGAAIETDGTSKRVVVVASGGLSHSLPFPKWDEPRSADDRFLVEAWSEGRGRWAEYDPRRREIIRAAAPRLSEDFDRWVLRSWCEGRMADVASMPQEELERKGGNGANEVRTWLIAAAAGGDRPGRTLAYSPMPEWLTGMAVGVSGEPDPLRQGAS